MNKDVCCENPLSLADWERQWADFAPGFDGTHAHIILENGSTLLLKPGPGFGDASHPTTRLMLRFLAKIVPYKRVLDVGCGSGILSLASCLLGAKYVHGIDIEEDAIAHSLENAKLNSLVEKVDFSLPQTPCLEKNVVLMNMISSEQKQAWQSLSLPSLLIEKVLVSGILQEERESYLRYVQSEWGFCLQEEWEEEGWLAFLFSVS